MGVSLSPSDAGRPFIPFRQFNGALVPEALLKYTGITRGAKSLYGVLARYAGADGLCFPRQRRLAVDLAASERSIQRWVSELVAAGLLARARRGRGNRANSYLFLWQPILGTQLLLDFSPPPAPKSTAVENPEAELWKSRALTRQSRREKTPPSLEGKEGQSVSRRRSSSVVEEGPVEITGPAAPSAQDVYAETHALESPTARSAGQSVPDTSPNAPPIERAKAVRGESAIKSWPNTAERHHFATAPHRTNQFRRSGDMNSLADMLRNLLADPSFRPPAATLPRQNSTREAGLDHAPRYRQTQYGT